MESEVRKKLSEKLLKSVNAEVNRKNRRSLFGRPQVLFLEDLNFIQEAIDELNSRYVQEFGKFGAIKVGAEELKIARDLAKPFQERYAKKGKRFKDGPDSVQNTIAYNRLEHLKDGTTDKINAGKAFIVGSFYSLGTLKRKIVDAIASGVLTDAQLKKLKSSIDRGHGGGKGNAVSNMTLQGGLKALSTAVGDDERLDGIKEAFKSFIQAGIDDGTIDEQIGDEVAKVIINYESNVTKTSGISAKYIPFIVYQNKYENRGVEAARDKQILKIARDFFESIGAEEIVGLEGSSSVRDKVIARAIKPIIDVKMAGKSIKLEKKIDPRKIKFSTKGRAEAKNKASGKPGGRGVTPNKKQAAKPARGRVAQAKQSTVSLATILAVLNSRLPDTVAGNMGEPALVNRTGTFAGSVRATDVTQTPQGFPSVGYTYEKQPYQVFESTSGTKFADLRRDPRPLIDKSIREIMAEYFIGRIYTRRE